MRLAGQIKQGFYPIAPAVVRLWARHVRVDDPERTSLLDPCCGEGEALATLAQELALPARNVYALELDQGRSARARERLVGSTVVGPADFHGARIAPCFSIVWLNPPFDDEMGGGCREENAFLSRSLYCLPPGGILALVIPEKQFNYRTKRQLEEHFVKLSAFRPPEEHRPFQEVIVTGVRKGKRQDYDDSDLDRPFEDLGAEPSIRRWTVEPRKVYRPHVFAKGGPTDLELAAMLAASPANQLFATPVSLPPARPMLPLSTGHSSLVVASGQVDGVIRPPGEEPHVVRGTTRKEKVLAAVEEKEESTTEIYREKMIPMVRTIGPDGVIRTFE